jgi:hypothetical protein
MSLTVVGHNVQQIYNKSCLKRKRLRYGDSNGSNGVACILSCFALSKKQIKVFFLLCILSTLLNSIIKPANGLRINSLVELQKDSSSITIEWSVSETSSQVKSAPTNTNNNEGTTINSNENNSDYLLSVSSTASHQNDNNNNINNVHSDWVGFKIKYFTEKLQYTPILLKNILFRKFRLDNLKSNTEYKIQVSAYNSLGDEGPASQLLTVRTYEAGC